MEVLILDGHLDLSAKVKNKGYGWTREDVDSEKSVRVKSGKMRRDKIDTKRKLSYELMNMTRAELAAVDDILNKPTYTATYLDLHGRMTRTFYTSSFSATLSDLYDEDGTWEEASFNMIEV